MCKWTIWSKISIFKKREKVCSKHYDNPKVFIEYSNDMEDIYKNIEEWVLWIKHKVLIAFVQMIADMINNKKLNPIVNELFIRGRKLNISIGLVT